MAKDFVVIGLGRFGEALCERLMERGHSVLAVDIDGRRVEAIVDKVTQAAQLDATNREALEEIEVAEFDTAIVSIGNNFEASVLATIFLKELGVRRIIAKAFSSVHEQVLLKVGADEVVFPEQKAGYDLGDALS